jgi:hypothetical protein
MQPFRLVVAGFAACLSFVGWSQPASADPSGFVIAVVQALTSMEVPAS